MVLIGRSVNFFPKSWVYVNHVDISEGSQLIACKGPMGLGALGFSLIKGLGCQGVPHLVVFLVQLVER